MGPRIRVALVALFALGLAAPGTAGPAPARPGGAPAVESSPARRYFTDVQLVDQDGRRRRLYSDLLHGKVVVVNSFYTACGNTCPVVMAAMARIQEALGERVGRDVHLLSITVDPVVDTPARLKAYASTFGARPGWYLLSGDAASVALALGKFGEVATSKEGHLNILLVGNERTGMWKKAFALAPPDALVTVVRSVVDDR